MKNENNKVFQNKNNIKFNTKKIFTFWYESSIKDFNTMDNLFISKDYNWTLFLGHLVIEKLLKAYFVKKFNKHPLFTHDLLRLAIKCGLQLSEEQQDNLDMITTFNISARYDNYKETFYQKCTKDFTEKWIVKIKELRQWITNSL